MKRILIVFALMLLLTGLLAQVQPSGTGTQNDPYLMATLSNLQWLSNNSSAWSSSTYIIQTADIDATPTNTWNSTTGFNPIGSNSVQFFGSYDGQGHVVDGLYINRPVSYQGLFGYLEGATVANLGITNADISGTSYIGAVTGYNCYSAVVSNCYSTGSVVGSYATGGLVGDSYSASIDNSYSTAIVMGYTNSGGLIGYNWSSSISNCYSTGPVSGNSGVGGLVGNVNNSTVTNSFWDTQTSGLAVSAGTEIGKTTAEMKTLSTFTSAGWDFEQETANGTANLWDMDYTNAINNGYPYLAWQDGASVSLPSSIPVGTGTQVDPYQIATLENLRWLSINNSVVVGTYFIQMNDIDASATQGWNNGEGFVSIGVTDQVPFIGNYDGQGFTIDGLYINRPNTNGQGLFGYIEGANIANLGVINVDITSNSYTGGLVGRCYFQSYIDNCFSTGSINASNYSGGLVGESSTISTIYNCYSSCNINGEQSVGGFVGINVSSSFILSSFSSGNVSATSNNIGGFAGYNTQNTQIVDCYSTGNVTSPGIRVGGFAGINIGNSIINKCYSTGLVTCNSTLVGGFIGVNSATSTNSFWDIDSSGKATSHGPETGKTTIEMKQLTTFANASWDFEHETLNGTNDNWDLDYSTAINNGYPYLAWEDGETVTLTNAVPYVANALVDFGFDEDTVDTSIDLSSVFLDIDTGSGDIITYSFANNSNIGVSIDANGVVTLTPVPDWNGNEAITFIATDSYNEFISDDVNVTINPTNDAPTIALPVSWNFVEDSQLMTNFANYTNDIEQDALTITVAGNTEVNVAINSLSVSFTATQDWNGTETLTFTVNDNQGRAVASDDIDITVTEQNDAPIVANAMTDFNFDEDTIDNSLDLSTVFDDVDFIYGDTHTYSYSSAGNIAVAIASNGAVTLTPSQHWNGDETIIFTATDNSQASVDEDVVVTINPINDDPTIILPASFSFDEDGQLPEDFANYATDIDLDVLTLTVTGNTQVNASITGLNVTFTAAEHWHGTETLTFTANDNVGRAIATDDIDIIVNSIEDTPNVANPIQDFNFDEDTVDSSIDLTSVFYDGDIPWGDEISFNYYNNNSIGIVISQDGTVILTPIADWNGAETITFRATDNNDNYIEDSVDITINPVNDSPTIALPDSWSFGEDGQLIEDFANYATDIDLDALSLSVAGNVDVIVQITNLNVTFTATQDWHGSEVLAFTVSDNQNRDVDVDYIQIIVDPLNDTPVVVNPIQDFSFDEDSIDTSIDLGNVFDDVDLIDGDAIAYSNSGNTNITVSISPEGLVTLTPAQDWNGNETITFTATDNDAAFVDEIVLVTVDPVNDTPTIGLPASFTIAEEGQLIEDFSAYTGDIDLDALSLSVTGDTNVTVGIVGMNVTFTGTLDWNGTETLTFTVNDNAGRAIASDDIDIIATYVNDSPVVANGIVDFSFTEDSIDTSLDLNNVFGDVDLVYGDAHAYSYTGNANISVAISPAGIVTLTPAQDWNGTETITFTATDNDADFITDTVDISVTYDNDTPIVANPITNFNFTEDTIDTSIDLSSVFGDVDLIYLDTHTYSYSGNSNIGVSISLAGLVTLTPNLDWNGAETITFTATDNYGALISDDVLIQIDYDNDAPIVANPIADFNFDEDTIDNSLDLSTVFDDVDMIYGDAHTYSFSGNTNIAIAITPAGLVTLTPAQDWNGNETITFTATDNGAFFVNEDVVVTINPINDIPTINLPVSFTIAEEGQLIEDFGAYTNDIDLDDLSITVTGDTNVTVGIVDLSVTFNGTLDWNGTETLTFTVNDNAGRAIASDDIDIIVTYVNDTPVVTNPITDFSFDEDTIDTSLDLSTVFGDVDLIYGDVHAFSYSGNSNIAIAITPAGMVTLTPAQDWNGTETISFTATDNGAAFVTDVVDISVTYEIDTPIVANPIADFNFTEDTIDTSLDLSIVFDDVDLIYGDTHTYSYAGNTNIGVSISPAGLVTLTPAQDWNGSETISFTATDSHGTYILDDVVVQIDYDNDTPIVANAIPNFSFAEDTIDTSIDLSVVFDDVDLAYGDSHIYSSSGNTNISVSISPAGIVTLNPYLDWNGTETITFTATDNYSAFITDAVDVTIIYGNDAPLVANPLGDFDFDEDTIDTSIDLSTVFSDVDLIYGDVHAFSNTGNTNIGVSISLAGIVTLTPAQDWNGTEVITFTATDNYGSFVSDDIEILINYENDAPIVANPIQDFNFDEDTVHNSIDLGSVFDDVDLIYGDELAFDCFGNVNIEVVISTAGIVTLTPAQNWNGLELLTFSASDNYSIITTDAVSEPAQFCNAVKVTIKLVI